MVYDNLIRQNTMINKFNNYRMNNPDVVPFQNNQLISKNPHIQNTLVNSVRENNTVSQTGKKNVDVIKEMLQPIKISKKEANADVLSNYHDRERIQNEAKEGKIGIDITNTAYKCIIKERDNIDKKKVHEITLEDLLVHRAIRGVDDDVKKFGERLCKKDDEQKKINDELLLEFNEDNRDMHKKKFEFKETFIRNMSYEENTYDDSKQDFIEFYKKQKKEANEKSLMMDSITKYIEEDTFGNNEEFNMEEKTVTNKIPIKTFSGPTKIKVPKISTTIVTDKPAKNIIRIRKTKTP